MQFRLFVSSLVCLGLTQLAFGGEYKNGIIWPEPEVVTPGESVTAPPSDAVVLFDGKDLSKWEGGDAWIIEDGVATVAKRGISTKDRFGDIQLHLEWAAPEKVSSRGQGRGNSGLFLMGKYEVQILDSYDNETYFDGQAASIYKQTPPMVNAMKKPGEWNTYDIIFTTPRRDKDGKVTTPAYVTVIHNGIVVQNHFEIQGSTFWHRPAEYENHGDLGPISLQHHNNPVRFRNIWVREISPIKPLGKKMDKGEESKEKPAKTPKAESKKDDKKEEKSKAKEQAAVKKPEEKKEAAKKKEEAKDKED